MPDNTNTTGEQAIVLGSKALEATRNEVTLPLVWREVSKRSKENKGAVYPAFDKKYLSAHIQELIKFLGADEVASIVVGKVSQWCQEWAEEATGADDTFDLDTFKKLVEEMSARGETIPDLQKRLQELAVSMADFDYSDPEQMQQAAKVGAEIKRVNAAIASKKRPREESVATLPAAKAA